MLDDLLASLSIEVPLSILEGTKEDLLLLAPLTPLVRLE